MHITFDLAGKIEKHLAQLPGRRFTGRSGVGKAARNSNRPAVNELLRNGLLRRKVMKQATFGDVFRVDHVADARGPVAAGIKDLSRSGEDYRSGSGSSAL